MGFPGRRDDFDSDEAYQHWRTQELAHLSQLMVIMVQFNPDLAKSMPASAFPSAYSPGGRPESMYSSRDSLERVTSNNRLSLAVPGGNMDSVAEEIQSDEDVEIGHNFTYIPPNPKKYYKRLIEVAVQYDLEEMVNLPEDQEVSLGILSAKNADVINECALRWRTLHSYRVTCFLDVIKYKFERDEVPVECIPEGLQMVQKAMQEVPLDKWPRADVSSCQLLNSLFNVLF